MTLLWLVVVSVLFVGAASFGVWAFMSRQDYKNNSDQKSAAAAAQSKKDTQAADATQYAEAAKNPLKTYNGPSQFGSLSIQYPKTWSAYIIENGKGSTPVDYYFHPDTVPDAQNDANSYSLRVQVVQDSYDRVLGTYNGQVQSGKIAVAPYSLPKVSTVVGSKLTGQITPQKQGTLILLPMRNLTLEVWTDAQQFEADFNNLILPNLTFSP